MLIRDPMTSFAAIFVLAVLGLAYLSARFEIAVYALSFWHYLVYALAFSWRKISHERFMRDSYILKIISLGVLGSMLWVTTPNPIALIAMAAGFALNIAAAQALGAERTYYGFELAALPPKRITAFPYSVTGHPMLIGNMLAFGAPLLDASFREAWWPFAIIHVLLNLLIILNEASGQPSRLIGIIWSVALVGGGAVLLAAGFWTAWPYGLLTAILNLLFGGAVIRRYT